MLDDAKFAELKATIEAWKSEKRLDVFRKPSQASGLLERDVRQILNVSDEAYACDEWVEAARGYITLFDAQVGPVSIVSRLALCHCLLGDHLESFDYSTQGINDCPAEASSYLAIAFIKLSLRQISDAARWLDLAELGLRSNPRLITEGRKEVDTWTILSAFSRRLP